MAPFGFGLHYTTFKARFHPQPRTVSIQKLMCNCKADYKDKCELPPIRVSVINTGKRTPDFVALVFSKSEVGPAPYPLKTLAAYTRMRDIRSGRTNAAKLVWTSDEQARREKNGDLVIYPGTYTLLLDEPTQVTTTITLTGKKVTLDKWPHDTSSDYSV
jgi:beta-D-xylosidase 4